MKENATPRLTLAVYKELVIRSIFGFLEVKLPTLHIHFQQHLGGDTQRFLLDLRAKDGVTQISGCSRSLHTCPPGEGNKLPICQTSHWGYSLGLGRGLGMSD